MSSDLRALYQEVILDHYKNPRNYGALEGADKAEGYNPLCGDQVTVYLKLKDEVVEDVGFQGSGCAISTAAASLMTESVKGKSLGEALLLFDRFQTLATSDPRVEPDVSELGKLAVFAGVREYPIRVKCATLPWHTLRAAAQASQEKVKTE